MLLEFGTHTTIKPMQGHDNKFIVPLFKCSPENEHNYKVCTREDRSSRSRFYHSGNMVGCLESLIYHDKVFYGIINVNDATTKGIDAISDLNFYNENNVYLPFNVAVKGYEVQKLSLEFTPNETFNF